MTAEDRQQAIYNAFDPNDPADARSYADCKEVRGGSALVRNIAKRLGRSANENLYYLFTGHLGCEKFERNKKGLEFVQQSVDYL